MVGFFLVANEWIRGCDCYQGDERVSTTCETCGASEMLRARYIQNGAFKGTYVYICPLHQDLVSIPFPGDSDRLPTCVAADGRVVNTIEGTTNPYGFSKRFLQKHILAKTPLPPDSYGVLNLK